MTPEPQESVHFVCLRARGVSFPRQYGKAPVDVTSLMFISGCWTDVIDVTDEALAPPAIATSDLAGSWFTTSNWSYVVVSVVCSPCAADETKMATAQTVRIDSDDRPARRLARQSAIRAPRRSADDVSRFWRPRVPEYARPTSRRLVPRERRVVHFFSDREPSGS